MKFSNCKNIKIALYSIISELGVIKQLFRFYLLGGSPPEYKKRKFIKNIISLIQFDNAIESGTYLGKTAHLLSKSVQNVFTIEISNNLYKYVKKKVY